MIGTGHEHKSPFCSCLACVVSTGSAVGRLLGCAIERKCTPSLLFIWIFDSHTGSVELKLAWSFNTMTPNGLVVYFPGFTGASWHLGCWWTQGESHNQPRWWLHYVLLRAVYWLFVLVFETDVAARLRLELSSSCVILFFTCGEAAFQTFTLENVPKLSCEVLNFSPFVFGLHWAALLSAARSRWDTAHPSHKPQIEELSSFPPTPVSILSSKSSGTLNFH